MFCFSCSLRLPCGRLQRLRGERQRGRAAVQHPRQGEGLRGDPGLVEGGGRREDRDTLRRSVPRHHVRSVLVNPDPGMPQYLSLSSSACLNIRTTNDCEAKTEGGVVNDPKITRQQIITISQTHFTGSLHIRDVSTADESHTFFCQFRDAYSGAVAFSEVSLSPTLDCLFLREM